MNDIKGAYLKYHPLIFTAESVRAILSRGNS